MWAAAGKVFAKQYYAGRSCFVNSMLPEPLIPASSLVGVPLINDNMAKVRQHARELGVDG